MSMKSKEKYLLVASFLEGKNFPRRAKTQFIIEAKFDGEQLATDPVEHVENLEINQELAWELDKKALQQHKLQRSVIKINCFAITNDSNKKENVGYFVLDIRSAPDYVGKPKWYTLLQSKYPKLKPEIKVNMYVEDDGVKEEQQLKPTRDPKIATVDSPYKGGGIIDSRKLKPILIESEGYFLIGPESHNSETFVLSITIVFAKNLVKLLPADFNYATNGTFFFSYVLMNNRILTETFSNILTSQINAERASIRIHSTYDVLKAFLKNHTPIDIFLCANNDMLIAKASLNISNLMRAYENVDLNTKPIVIDEILKLQPIVKQSNQQLQQQQKLDDSSVIGVQLILRKETVIVDVLPNLLELQLANKAENNLVNSIDNANNIGVAHNGDFNKTDKSTPKKLNTTHTPPNITPIKTHEQTAANGGDKVQQRRIEIRTPSPTDHLEQGGTVTKNQITAQSQTPPVSARHYFEINEKPQHQHHNQQQQQQHVFAKNSQNNAIDSPEFIITEEMQLRAAYEIQLWKQTREKEFEHYLKELEAKKLHELAEAFKQRDKERELIVQKKIKEYSELEIKLKNTLNELDKREKVLSNNEINISRIRVDLQRDYELKLNELREASKRVQEQAEHHLSLQKAKCESLEEEIQRLKRQLLEAEKRYADKEAEFIRYKDKENSKPEVRLQSEINVLNIEKNGLERKLETAIKSKNHYKEQWIKALQEIAALKRREEANSIAFLKKQQIELDHLRMRYLAAEENNLMKTDEKELESLKNQLNKMKSGSNEDIKSSLEDIDANLEDHIARLIEERDTLLKTGVYSTKDSIIIELDRKIREGMNQVKK